MNPFSEEDNIARLKSASPEFWQSLTLTQKETFASAIRNYESYNHIYDIAKKWYKGRFMVLLGGAGSGKSYAVAEKIIERMINEEGHRILCVRKQKNQIAESQFKCLQGAISRYCSLNPKKMQAMNFKICEAEGKESIVNKKNKNEILFAGLDDPEKLKSIFDITGIWIEEADQINEADFWELETRLRGHSRGKYKNGKPRYEQIILSLNPVSNLCWVKKLFFDDEEKIFKPLKTRGKAPFEDFMQWEDFSMLYEDENDFHIKTKGKNLLLVHSTYLDNKFLKEEEAEKAERQRLKAPDRYVVYYLGQWGISGGTYFDREQVNKRIIENPQPIKRGFFDFQLDQAEKIIDESIKWVDDPEGYIKIYEEPKAGYPYALGGDTAGEGSDYNIGYVINNHTDQDAAVLRYKFDEDLYAQQVYCLGKYYNFALVGIETNFSTHPQKELERLNYPNLYVREEAPDSMTGRLTKKYGWNTNKATRPLVLSQLRTLVRERIGCIKCLDTLYEMTTFVTNEKGKPEAQSGQHDDLIMARAITIGISGQQTKEITVTAETLTGEYYTDDELECLGLSKYQIKMYKKTHANNPWGNRREA